MVVPRILSSWLMVPGLELAVSAVVHASPELEGFDWNSIVGIVYVELGGMRVRIHGLRACGLYLLLCLVLLWIVQATKFNSLTKWERFTLLDLHFFTKHVVYFDPVQLWSNCGRLSMMQNQSCSAIFEDVRSINFTGRPAILLLSMSCACVGIPF